MSTSFADELLDDVQEERVAAPEVRTNGAMEEEEWGNMQDDDDDDGVGSSDDGQEEMSHAVAEERREIDSGDQTNGNKHTIQAAQEMDEEEVEKLDLRPERVRSVREVCTLLDSKKMQEVMKDIEVFSSGSQQKPDFEGVWEDSSEYRLIVEANNLAVNIDNEGMVSHKFIRQRYKPRFPELESMIGDPWEFVRAVRAIGNPDNLSNAKLDGVLPHGTIVVMSMQASTTKGRKLSPESWASVEEACMLSLSLNDAREKITQYVESRMTIIAPNLSKVVGTRVATKLLGIVGGLQALTKVPACNVLLLGAQNKTTPGMSTAFSKRHEGVIAQAPLIVNTPPDIHRQAIRIVSAKALLAARVDAGGSEKYGAYGARLTQELEKKLEKLQEPLPAKMIKALPVPREGASLKKRRGGRKARKMKERRGMTELRKMQNRVRFGEAEEEAGAFDETVGLGMISSKGDSGRLRATLANDATKSRMSKRNTERIQAIQHGSAARQLDMYEKGMGSGASNRLGGETSGTASSLAFTPFQGIELVDPSRQRKVDEANAKWFKEGTFSLLPGKPSTIAPSSSTVAGSKGTEGESNKRFRSQ